MLVPVTRIYEDAYMKYPLDIHETCDVEPKAFPMMYKLVASMV